MYPLPTYIFTCLMCLNYFFISLITLDWISISKKCNHKFISRYKFTINLLDILGNMFYFNSVCASAKYVNSITCSNIKWIFIAIRYIPKKIRNLITQKIRACNYFIFCSIMSYNICITSDNGCVEIAYLLNITSSNISVLW